MSTKYLSAALLGLLAATSVHAGSVTITKESGNAVIRVGEEVLGVYRFSKDLPKPYLIAVSAPGAIDLLISELDHQSEDEFAAGNRVFVAVEKANLTTTSKDGDAGHARFGEILDVTSAADGRLEIKDRSAWIKSSDVVPLKGMVTRVVSSEPNGIKDRKHPLYYDHPHHKGVWNSIDEVNGIKFWNEDGRIENVSVDVTSTGGDSASFNVVNHWLATDGAPLLKEEVRITVHANRLLTYDIRFTAQDQPVTFGDTKEGMFAIRLPNSMREFISQGPVTGPDGQVGTKSLWGRAVPWIDYVGAIDGHRFDVTLMDHPSNPRPSRYHVRDYGLFAINPFGRESYTKGTDEAQSAEELTLRPGESVRFRYGLYIHRGDAAEGDVAGVYDAFQSSK